MNFVTELDKRFGSDEALGVAMCLDNGDIIALNDYLAMKVELGDDAPDAQSLFPDGRSATCCTDFAIQVAKGLPGRVQIWGFANEDNPGSRVAQEELHPDGHDFALVDERYLVDPWIRLVVGESGACVFDLHDAADAAIVLKTYGPQECWTHNADLDLELALAQQKSELRQGLTPKMR